MPATTVTTVPLLFDLSPTNRGALTDFDAFRQLVRGLLVDRSGLDAFVLFRAGAGEHLEPMETIGYGGDTVRRIARRLDAALAADAERPETIGAAELLGSPSEYLASSAEPAPTAIRLIRTERTLVGVLVHAGDGAALDDEALAIVAGGLETRAELARLLRSYDFTRSILRDVPTGIIAIDTLGRVIFLNAAAERVLGISSGEAVGADALRIFRTLVDGENLLLEGLDGDRPMTEVWVRRHTGGEVPVELVLSRIRSRDGAVLGAVGMFHDLSELRAMQERMRHRDRLATIGELAAGIAHEIGNPLTGIRGCAQILRDRLGAGDESQELIGVILEEVDRLNRLSEQVRHYGRPRAPRMRKASVLESIDRVLAVMGPTADEAGISIVRNELTEVPEIYHDPDQIQQVLQNLVKNAIDAMDEGGRLEVSVEHVRRKVFTRPMGRRAGDRVESKAVRVERDYVHVRVMDTGPGISDEIQERIFNPFFTTKAAGLGLGLSISQTIVSEHGGLLSVVSQPGKGTTFTLDLPVDRRAK
jgi:PAS domain S-box-containing protein